MTNKLQIHTDHFWPTQEEAKKHLLEMIEKNNYKLIGEITFDDNLMRKTVTSGYRAWAEVEVSAAK